MGRSLVHFLKSISQKLFPRKRRKNIEDWDFIMVFNISVKQQIKQYFSLLQCSQNVKFQFVQHKQQDKLLVLIAMNQKIVLKEAHQLKILKIKQKKSFKLNIKQIHDQIDKAQSQNSTHYADYMRFIRARLDTKDTRILQQQKYSVFNMHKKEQYPKNQNGQLFSSQQQLRCKYNFLLSYKQTIKHQTSSQDIYRFPFIDIMKHSSYQQLISIHKNSRFHPIIFDSVKNYVGSNDQVYFEFVSFLQKWLIFPAVVGILTTLFNYFYQYSADDSPGDFVYSLLIMIWSIYFITNWENQSKWIKVKQSSGYNDQLWSSQTWQIEQMNILSQIMIDLYVFIKKMFIFQMDMV